MSLFIYPATILGIDDTTLNEIDTKISAFLWNSKNPKVAKSVIQNKISEGGLKMPNIYVKIKT